MATVAGMAMLVFDQVQNQTSLWDSLLIIPKLLSSSSVDQGIDSVKTTLISVQRYVPTVSGDYGGIYVKVLVHINQVTVGLCCLK